MSPWLLRTTWTTFDLERMARESREWREDQATLRACTRRTLADWLALLW